jgi:hypothetical protein
MISNRGGHTPQVQQERAPTRTLFDQQIYIKLRATQREDFVKQVGLKLYFQLVAQSQSLVIELTDEADPLFLYQMVCSEQDFHLLKQD